MWVSLQAWCQVCNEEDGREQLPAVLYSVTEAFGRARMLCQKLLEAFLDRKEKRESLNASQLLSKAAFALLFLLILCMMLWTSCSVLCHIFTFLHIPHHFCASEFYFCITLPTVLLTIILCFAFVFSLLSPSFHFLLPLHVVFLMVLLVFKPVSPVFPSWSSFSLPT